MGGDDAVGLVVIGDPDRRHADICQGIDERKFQRHHARGRFVEGERAMLVLDGDGGVRGESESHQRGEKEASVHRKAPERG
jgi:hypothetical protein